VCEETLSKSRRALRASAKLSSHRLAPKAAQRAGPGASRCIAEHPQRSRGTSTAGPEDREALRRGVDESPPLGV
jgi:hypothetical protein